VSHTWRRARRSCPVLSYTACEAYRYPRLSYERSDLLYKHFGAQIRTRKSESVSADLHASNPTSTPFFASTIRYKPVRSSRANTMRSSGRVTRLKMLFSHFSRCACLTDRTQSQNPELKIEFPLWVHEGAETANVSRKPYKFCVRR
jgi:hypothetical protein